MTEQLLQFIWQFRYYNRQGLYTESGEPLHIHTPGVLNTHQGPDFLQATLTIGTTRWVGNIELHLLTSGWEKHAHAEDPHYNNVVLHVVWENDREDTAGTIPVLVLQRRVPKLLLGQYSAWMKSRRFVPCERQMGQVGEALWEDWKQALLIGRLQRKALFIQDCLQQNRRHWDETAWWLMARNFGLPVNTETFDAIARTLSFALLSRHRQRPEQLEALLLGQAGLLEGDLKEDYPLSLQREFRHLRSKYRLRPVHEPLLMLRMRPGNFPAVRLAQLAGLLHASFPWFGRIREAGSLQELKVFLQTGTSPYWDDHYIPGRSSVHKRKDLGAQMRQSLLINTCLPLLYAYGSQHGEKDCRDRALRWFSQTGAEKNGITSGWVRLGRPNRHAADSQALLELKTRYCDGKKCLDCAIGKALLGSGKI